MRARTFRERSEHNLDAKGRLNIPARFLSILNQRESDVLIIAPWFEHLRAYPVDTWAEVEEQLLSGGNSKNPNFANWVRMTMGALSEVSPDKQGRILISQILRKKAGLEKEVVLTGMGTWFEIWDKSSILAKDEATMEDSEAHKETLAEMGFLL